MTPLQASRALRDIVNVPSQIAGKVAKRFSTDLQVRFSSGQDPYKKKWAPLAPATIKKGRYNPPLTDTRKLRNGVKFRPSQGAGITITSSAPYGVYHMRKSGKRPARKFLPENVLPAAWFKIWQEELDAAVKAKLLG